jgi:hypothetical protein
MLLCQEGSVACRENGIQVSRRMAIRLQIVLVSLWIISAITYRYISSKCDLARHCPAASQANG